MAISLSTRAAAPVTAGLVPPLAVEAIAAPSTLRQLVSFGAIGVVSTIAYAALYAALRAALDPAASNAVALLLTAIANTAANRRLTFAVRDRTGVLRDQAAGLVALGIALAITSTAVTALGAVAPGAGRATELTVLVTANAVATLCRFVVLRRLIAGPRRAATPQGRREAAEPKGALR